MNAVDWGVLIVLVCAVSIGAVTSWFVLRELRRRREAVAAPPPPPMEKLWLRVKLTDGTWEDFNDVYPAGTAFMSVGGIREFVKWFHCREQSKTFRLGCNARVCLPRAYIMYYKLAREKI